MMVLRAQGVHYIPLFCLLPLSLPPLLPLPLSQCPHQTPAKTPTSTSLPCMALLLFLPLPLLLPRQRPWLQSLLLYWKVVLYLLPAASRLLSASRLQGRFGVIPSPMSPVKTTNQFQGGRTVPMHGVQAFTALPLPGTLPVLILMMRLFMHMALM